MLLSLSVLRAFWIRARVKGGKPDTLDKAGVVEVFEDFIDKKLAFPIRVSSVDYGGGLTKQMVDYLKLCVGFFFGAKFPFIGANGEIAPRHVRRLSS